MNQPEAQKVAARELFNKEEGGRSDTQRKVKHDQISIWLIGLLDLTQNCVDSGTTIHDH